MGRKKKTSTKPEPGGMPAQDDVVDEVSTGVDAQDVVVDEPQAPTVPTGRISGDDLKARLRQERREARLKEKGY